MDLSFEGLHNFLLETDFKGQQMADRTYQWVIVIFTVRVLSST